MSLDKNCILVVPSVEMIYPEEYFLIYNSKRLLNCENIFSFGSERQGLRSREIASEITVHV